MPLDDVSQQMRTRILDEFKSLSVDGKTLPDVSKMINTFEFANDIIDGLKTAITAWALTSIASTTLIFIVGPIIHIVNAPLTNVSLSGLKTIITANIRQTYDQKRLELGASSDFDTFGTINDFLVEPISDAIDTIFTIFATSFVGAFTIGVGVPVPPPPAPPVQSQITYIPSKPLSAINFPAQATETAIKALALANLGTLINQNQVFLLSYYDAIAKGAADVINSTVGSLQLTAVIPALLNAIGAPGVNTFTMVIT